LDVTTIKEDLKIQTNIKTMENTDKNNFNATIGNIVLGEVYWTYNVTYLPIQVKVLEVDEEKQKAKIEQGWIDFDRLYKTENDCPQR